jgi:thiamine biosynthesis lipoprotein
MGTLVRIVLYAPSTSAGEAAAAAALARIAALDARLSDYRDDSEVAALSRAPVGVAVPLSDDLFAILDASETLSRRSGGAFDVTAGRLTHLWRRARRLNAWPDAGRVADARAAGGAAKVQLDRRRRTATLTEAGIELDAGGIAKGYAADQALRVLRDRGHGAALVAIAGDIVAGDPPPGQAAWTVAIPRLSASAPVIPPADAVASDAGTPDGPHRIPLVRAAVSTSGDAEQWMTVDGVRHSHVIDLRTGWPVSGRSTSSVVAARGIDADAVSTALGIMDAEAGARLLQTVRGPGADRRQGSTAQALWQRLDAAGVPVSHHSSHWPAIVRPISAITLRGTP